MYTAKLRAVGGSVMFAIPKPMLDGLDLHANQQVGVSISGGRMIVEPKVRLAALYPGRAYGSMRPGSADDGRRPGMAGCATGRP